MANTFTKIYIHIVFSTKGRYSVIDDSWKNTLYSYIGGLINKVGCTPISIGGTENHIHILTILGKTMDVAKLVQTIKTNSSKWINENRFIRCKFEWQDGYGCFSVSQSIVEQTKAYINNQEEHHKRKSFKDEFIEFLKAYKIEYDKKYLPQNPEEIE